MLYQYKRYRNIISSTPQSNYLQVGNESKTLYANEGDDYFLGRSVDDTLFGEKGNDYLFGQDDNDDVIGDKDDDYMAGGTLTTCLRGGWRQALYLKDD